MNVRFFCAGLLALSLTGGVYAGSNSLADYLREQADRQQAQYQGNISTDPRASSQQCLDKVQLAQKYSGSRRYYNNSRSSYRSSSSYRPRSSYYSGSSYSNRYYYPRSGYRSYYGGYGGYDGSHGGYYGNSGGYHYPWSSDGITIWGPQGGGFSIQW